MSRPPAPRPRTAVATGPARGQQSDPPLPYLGWLLTLVVIGLTVWLRLPTFNDHILFIDEPIYYSFAARLDLPGAHVYTHTADQKPPLGPLTYWLAIRLSSDHAITVAHVFTTGAIAATAVLLLVSSRALLGSPWAGFWASILYALIGSSTPTVGKPFFAFSSLEHFQAPWLIGFILMFLLSLRRRDLQLAVVAGAALGIAALYKPNVAVLLGPAWLVAALATRRGRLPFSRAAVLAAVATVAAAATIGTAPLYYAAVGHFDAWRFYNVDVLLLYSSLGGSVLKQAGLLARAIPLQPFLYVGIVYGVLAAFHADRSDWIAELGTFLGVGWIILFYSLAPGLHKAHYLIQGLPFQCFLIGLLVADGWDYVARARRNIRPVLGAVYVVLLLLPLGFATYKLLLGWSALSAYAIQDSYLDLHRRRGTLAPLVRYIQTHSEPNDLIYVHSEAPEFYFLTQRRPAASDPTGSWIALAPSATTADRLLADLQATPPRLIVQLDYRRYGRTRETLQKWPQLWSWVYQHYREHAHVDHVQIFEWAGRDAPGSGAVP